MPSTFCDITGLVISELADGHFQFVNIGPETCEFIFLQHTRGSLGTAGLRGWTKLVLGHYRGLVLAPKLTSPPSGRLDFPRAPRTLVDNVAIQEDYRACADSRFQGFPRGLHQRHRVVQVVVLLKRSQGPQIGLRQRFQIFAI